MNEINTGTDHPLDRLNLALEHARGVVELVATATSSGEIECSGYISTNGLSAALSGVIDRLEEAGEIVKALPRVA